MSKIIERIQKLLKLSANAGSEHEAALAAERAAELMTIHEIHEAQLSLDGPNVPRKPEPIDHSFRVTDTSKKVAWHMRVLQSVARSYGAHAYWRGGAIVLFGRLSAVQAATYTGQYLMREIERVTDTEAPSSSKAQEGASTWSRSYRNAFRLGCASRIASRLDEKTRPSKLVKMPDGSVQRVDEAARAPDDEIPSPSAGALAVIKKDHEEVEQAYKDFSKGWRKGGSVGNYSSGGGYEAGRQAGGRVSLGGGRAGLPRGQGSLK